MAEFTGRIKKIVIEFGEKAETRSEYLIIADNNGENGFGEVTVVLEKDGKKTVESILSGLKERFNGFVLTGVKVTAPNIKKGGVVRLNDPEVELSDVYKLKV